MKTIYAETKVVKEALFIYLFCLSWDCSETLGTALLLLQYVAI